jgi:hypothetical protein
MSPLSRLFLISLVTLAPAAAAAQDSTPRIDNREHRQAHRIADGVADGELTARETGRLLRGQVHVRRLEHRALADDGVVGPRERRRIEQAQDVQSRRIFRQKHDRQGR